MRRPYPEEVEAVVSFELDAQAAAANADRTQQRLESQRILGARLAVHLQRIGVPGPRR